jgi:hypothetical protein
MSVVQKWLVIMGALGAGALVLANPNAVFRLAQSATQVVGGTESTIITSKARQAG